MSDKCLRAAGVICLWAVCASAVVVGWPTLSPQPPPPTINKCCPEEEILSPTLEGCVPRPPEMNVTRDGALQWWVDEAALAGAEWAGPERGASAVPGGWAAAAPCPWASAAVAFASAPGRHLRAHLRPDGVLLLSRRADSSPPTPVPHTHFCADAVLRGGAGAGVSAPRRVFVACVCGGARACVRKCCPEGLRMRVEWWRKSVAEECAEEGDGGGDTHALWTPLDGALWRGNAAPPLVFFRPLQCGEGLKAVVVERSALSAPAAFQLLPTGRVLVADIGHGHPFGVEHACVDGVMTDDGQAREGAVVCAAPAPVHALAVTTVARLAAPTAVGGAFLLATLAVFALLPREARRSAFRLQAAQAATLVLGHTALVASFNIPALPAHWCYTLAFVVQFSFLAAFFWLNVMCIDIAWAFKGVRAPGSNMRGRERRKFLLYSAYAWCCPALITAATATLEFAEGLPEGLLRPNFGARTCWFYGKMATLAYFYGPIAALLAANVVLFAVTAVRIVRAQREAAVLRRVDSGRHDPRGETKRLVLYLKLFCLMGVTWVFEIISWAEGSDSVYWYVADAINMLRGVFIFVLFCCKPKVLQLLRCRMEALGVWRKSCACSSRCCWGRGGGEDYDAGGGVGGGAARGARGGGGAGRSTATTLTTVSSGESITSVLSKMRVHATDDRPSPSRHSPSAPARKAPPLVLPVLRGPAQSLLPTPDTLSARAAATADALPVDLVAIGDSVNTSFWSSALEVDPIDNMNSGPSSSRFSIEG